MARPKKPTYGTVEINGTTYYRTRVRDADGKRVPLYALTPDELTEKKEEALQQIKNASFHRENPTVSDYCDKWLEMQSANIKTTTLGDYRSIVKNYIKATIGDMYLADVTPDDLKLHVMTKAASRSKSVYGKVNMILKMMFTSAVDSKLIDSSPAEKLNAKGGKEPKEETALTDEQVEILLKAIQGLPPYPFVMIGLYAGLRREEILALQWDCVDLESTTPTITVKRSWHIEHNRPVISDELKTKTSRRTIPIPPILSDCLRDQKKQCKGQFVIGNQQDGGPLSGTQWQRLWKYIETRSTKPRTYTRYLSNGEKVKHSVTPVLGKAAAHNGQVVYSIDFHVHPHQLRRTYITNLCEAGVDPKTVQFLAGHKNISMTMDIYAKLKYNRPEDIAEKVNSAFGANVEKG